MFDLPFLTTNAGRVLFLQCLYQEPTYHGLLEGFALRERNERWMARWRERAATEFHDGHAAVVIPPVALATAVNDRMRSIFERRGDVPETIPSVTCVAVLESHEPTVSEPDEMCSSLAVIWFQSTPAMPLEPKIEAALKDIDWDGQAWAWTP